MAAWSEHNYCTLFDADYLPRALALYRSLDNVLEDFRLRAYCMDPGLAADVSALGLEKLIAIDIQELEAADPELAAVRPLRSAGEYCWTATPVVCLHSLDAGNCEAVTYLDSDLFFHADPACLFEEAEDASVLIVPHRFSARWAHTSRTHGTYNVGFNGFRRDERGLDALHWWRERCLEWCSVRPEPGRYGDQLYLDEFPRLFPGVHVVENPGADVAPWNSAGVQLARGPAGLTVDGLPLVFYHHASLRLYRPASSTGARRRIPGAAFRTLPGGDLVWRPWPGYRLSERELSLVWEPYVRELSQAFAVLHEAHSGYAGGYASLERADWARDALDAWLPAIARRWGASARRRWT